MVVFASQDGWVWIGGPLNGGQTPRSITGNPSGLYRRPFHSGPYGSGMTPS